ncbi:YciI family protein [Pseudarthrobacter sp. NS4]|uniref:YciI family protein n=1 Tax=Pseudarthrobacter sp. NS4 TaxID=2973976 RepID=UPI00216204D2|nr:YciI family protein [Pseudarthrobacter sp. NS4]
MKKFVVLYIAPQSAQEQMQESTPEAAQEGMKAWMEWAGRAGDGLVDMGKPLGAGREITATGTSDATNGVAGYALVQAEDLEAAQALFDGHPHLMMPGATIQVYESLDLPGM